MQPSFSVITTAAVCLVLSYLLACAQRGVPDQDSAGNIVFRYSAAFRGFAVFAAFGIPILLTVLMIIHPAQNSSEAMNYLLCYALFAGMAFPLLWETARLRVIATPEGLDCLSPWRGQMFFRWNEIREVAFNAGMYWFVVRTADGRVFRMSTFVAGISNFLALCEQHLPPDALRKAKTGYSMVGRAFPGDVEPRRRR